MFVVGDDEGHRLALATNATDDRAEHVRELGADDQKPFDVGLGGGDVEQRNDLAAVGQTVLDDVVVGEFAELFDSNSGVAQDFDGCPRPNVQCSSKVWSRRLAVSGSSAQTWVTPRAAWLERRSVSPATQNISPVLVPVAMFSRSAASRRSASALRASVGSALRRSRLRWSILDLR